MIRPALIEVLLFIAPFAAYAVFLVVTRSGVVAAASWPVRHLMSLAIVALLLVAASFIFFAHFSGAPPGADYMPAHMENGKFVPGTIK
jgi:O-antigen ligase